MAAFTAATNKKHKNKKNRTNKVNLVFDEDKRREFLTGFHKRKLQRKKDWKDKLEKDLKEERRRLKAEAKESYKKLVVSHRPIPELEPLFKEEYEDNEVTVKIIELSTNDIAKKHNFIGANQPRCQDKEESDEEESGDEKEEEIPGMELKQVPKGKVKADDTTRQKFESERDVKKLLKKEATRKVKKSKVFQMKNKIEKQKQKKKSFQMKKQRIKIKEKQGKRRH